MASGGQVPRFTVRDAPVVRSDLGDGISGRQAILHMGDDGTRLAGSVKESGVFHELIPFDEFLCVVTLGDLFRSSSWPAPHASTSSRVAWVA